MIKKTSLLLFFMAFLATVRPHNAPALDFWQYPEMAEKHSLFLSCFFVEFNFDDYFLFYPELVLDYLLPVGLPFSIGVSVESFDPDLYSAGLRLGYHINFDDENLDVYLLYGCKLIFPMDYVKLEYGGRFGFRHRFGSYFCITFETGFLLENFFLGIAVKFY